MSRFEGITYKGIDIEFEDVKAVENAAEAFSELKAYTTGDYCTYEGTLYQFVADHSAGWWNAADVEQIHIADKLNELNDGKADIIVSSASGAIASFSDGADDLPVKKLVAQIEPVQNLHGYDHPWPVGGGKNKLPLTVAGIKAVNTSGSWSGNAYTSNGITFTIQTDDNGNVTGIKVSGTSSGNSDLSIEYFNYPEGSYILNGCPNGGGDSSFCIIAGTSDVRMGIDNGNGATFTTDGTLSIRAIIRVYSGYTANNLNFLPMVRLSSISDGTFAPYSNICPITGWTRTKVTRTGKNLLDVSSLSFTNYDVIPEWEPNANRIGVCGDVICISWMNGAYLHVARHLDWMKAGTYTISCDLITGIIVDLWILKKDGTRFMISFTSDHTEESFTAPDDWSINFAGHSGQGINEGVSSFRIQIEKGSVASEYEPYQGETIQITFPAGAGTVYSGTLDVISGVLTVDRAYKVFNGSDIIALENWRPFQDTTAWVYPASITPGIKSVDYTIIPKILSNRLKTASYSDIFTGTASISCVSREAKYGIAMRVSNTSLTTSEAINAWLSENPVQVVYELVTPITYTLSAEQVHTLLGYNNIWADTGDVEVTYPADTKLYIDNKITQAIAAALNA